MLIKQQTLKCLDRLINRLSNLPLPLQLIDDLFHYASSTWSIDALNCIHELVLKQHLPRQYDSILHSSFQHIIQLLLIVNQTLTTIIINKIIEILRSLFNLHLKRCESIEHFPLFELLTGFYKFTLQQVKVTKRRRRIRSQIGPLTFFKNFRSIGLMQKYPPIFFSFLCFKFLLKQNTINQQRIYHCYL